MDIRRLAPLLLIVAGLAGGILTSGAQTQSGTPQKDPDSPTDLTEGQTPAELFAEGCQVCHQRPQGLAKSDVRSLGNFLRQHYTSSSQTAAAMAADLVSLPQSAPARARPGPQQANTGRPDDSRAAPRRAASGKPDDAAARAKPASEPPAPPKPPVPEIPD